MRLKTAALLASVWLASCGAAMALPGDEVTVNPIPAGGGVLLYPGGQYMRVLPPLLEPGQNPKGIVHLHMPGKHPARTRQAQASAPAPAPAETPPPKPVRTARATPSPVAQAQPVIPGYNSGYGSFGPAESLTPAKPAPAPSKPAPARPTQLAKAEPPVSAKPAPPPAAEEAPATPGLTKRSVILFAPDSSDPAKSALGAIKFLAGDLNAAMTGASSRIQILAFGGTRGDKGSDARRLSLKRALSIRQVLIDDGVPAERIDVRAMGGVDDTGPADRVDVYIKA